VTRPNVMAISVIRYLSCECASIFRTMPQWRVRSPGEVHEGVVEHLQDDADSGRTSFPARMLSSAGASLLWPLGRCRQLRLIRVGCGRT
jgi:hypothetical protein